MKFISLYLLFRSLPEFANEFPGAELTRTQATEREGRNGRWKKGMKGGRGDVNAK